MPLETLLHARTPNIEKRAGCVSDLSKELIAKKLRMFYANRTFKSRNRAALVIEP